MQFNDIFPRLARKSTIFVVNMRAFLLSHMRAVSPEPPLLAHTRSESRGTFKQKARSLAALNGWACAVKICHDGMLEDTISLDAAQIIIKRELTDISISPRETIVQSKPGTFNW